MKITVKKIYPVAFLVMIIFLLIRCENTKVGYLEVRDAVYSPDSMVVKSVLDTMEDADRIKFHIPWQSTSIEGIQGTTPIHYEIRAVDSDPENSVATSQFNMVRKGVIELPWNHTVPPGRYIISIRIFNEGYSYDLDSVYTVIVE